MHLNSLMQHFPNLPEPANHFQVACSHRALQPSSQLRCREVAVTVDTFGEDCFRQRRAVNLERLRHETSHTFQIIG